MRDFGLAERRSLCSAGTKWRKVGTKALRAQERLAILVKGMRSVVPIAVISVALLLSSMRAEIARADAFNYQLLPLGQRALGIGGAFTGIADDPSAAYYNPAGLALVPDSALSASLTLNAFDRRRIERGYRTAIGEKSLRHENQPSLPVFVTLVKKIGRKHEGSRYHAVALSTFTVSQRRLAFEVEQRGMLDGEDHADTFSATREEVTVWNGLSYAYRVSPKLSLGLSAFLSYTKSTYTQEHIAVTLGALDPNDDSYANRRSEWETYRTRTFVRNGVFRLGALYQLDERTRLGIMLQPPSIHLRGVASVRERLLTSNGAVADGGRFFNAQQKDLSARAPWPWEIRIGASREPLTWLTLALDVSLYGANGSSKEPIVAVGKRTPAPDTGAIAGVGDLTAERWHAHMTSNVSLGAEAVINDKIALRAGTFTSLSAAPSVPDVSAAYSAPEVDFLGGTFSVGYVASGFDLSLGLAGLFGFGDGQSFSPDATPEEAYRRTAVRDGMLFIFLSGAKSAVSKLAAAADRELQERLKARAAGED
jgi:long-chain fatty acid transport protein